MRTGTAGIVVLVGPTVDGSSSEHLPFRALVCGHDLLDPASTVTRPAYFVSPVDRVPHGFGPSRHSSPWAAVVADGRLYVCMHDDALES